MSRSKYDGTSSGGFKINGEVKSVWNNPSHLRPSFTIQSVDVSSRSVIVIIDSALFIYFFNKKSRAFLSCVNISK